MRRNVHPTVGVDAAHQEQAIEPHPQRWAILGVLVVSLLVAVLDGTVLNVAIPTLMLDLGATTSDVQLMLDSYLVVFAGLLLTAGSLSDRFGRRAGLLVGLALFGVASLLASQAATSGQLIAFRASMGAGAAFLMPSTLSIITTVFAEDERKKALAVWASALLVGALCGPVVGGLLLEHFDWGAIFLVNVPIAVLAGAAAGILIPESRGAAARPDVAGAVLSIVGIGALVWAIVHAGQDGWSPATVGGLVAAVAALVAFGFVQHVIAEPMVPLQLFRDRSFTGAGSAIVLMSFVSGGLLLALTQYLQFVLGYSPVRAGVAVLPMIGGALVFNGVGVVLDKKAGPRTAIVVGLLLLCVGFGLLARTSPGDGYGSLVLAMILVGAGSGCAGPAATGTLLGAVPADRAGVSSAVNDTVAQVGQALSVAVLGSILAAVYIADLPDSVPDAVDGSIAETLAAARASGDGQLANVARDSFVHALDVTSLVGVGIAIVAVLVVAVLLHGTRRADEQADH
jgi:EmrB/QacA subfamily drug resistance transporter